MKKFKSTDLFIQVFLLLLMVVAYFIKDPEKLNPIVILILFGAVQIISILANLGSGPQPWKMKTLRKYHLIGTGLVLILIVVAFMQDSSRGRDDKYSMPGLDTLVYASIAAIVLALFYTVITGLEWNKMKKVV